MKTKILTKLKDLHCDKKIVKKKKTNSDKTQFQNKSKYIPPIPSLR